MKQRQSSVGTTLFLLTLIIFTHNVADRTAELGHGWTVGYTSPHQTREDTLVLRREEEPTTIAAIAPKRKEQRRYTCAYQYNAHPALEELGGHRSQCWHENVRVLLEQILGSSVQ